MTCHVIKRSVVHRNIGMKCNALILVAEGTNEQSVRRKRGRKKMKAIPKGRTKQPKKIELREREREKKRETRSQ